MLFFWGLGLALPALSGGPGLQIGWEGVRRLPVSESQTLEVIYFQGAVYADSLPDVPLYTHRVAGEVPYFTTVFQLSDKVFAPVSEQEQAILEQAGFRRTEVVLHAGSQWERRQRHQVLHFYPFRYVPESGRYEKLLSFTLHTERVYDPRAMMEQPADYPGESVLSSGAWFRVCVPETGVYRLGYDDLLELGVDVQGLQKSQVGLFGNGGGLLPEANNASRTTDLVENAIHISGTAGGPFGPSDYMLFYGESPHRWVLDESTGVFRHEVHLYAEETCYFLNTTGVGQGRRVTAQAESAASPTHTATRFTDRAYHQLDQLSLIGSGRQWFGELFDATLTRQITFDLGELDLEASSHVAVSAAARSPFTSSFTIRAGSGEATLSIPSVDLLDYNNFFARQAEASLWFRPARQGPLQVGLTYNKPAATARGWLQYVAVNAIRPLRFAGPQMGFRSPDVTGPGHVVRHVLSGAGAQVTVWDVTDRFHVRSQEMTTAGNAREFVLPADSLREFIAFDGSTFPTPRLAGRVENQNLHGMARADLFILSPPAFLEQAVRLAEFRALHDGLDVAVVTPQQVYNEFSSGVPDASAIRNFMKMFYDRADSPSALPRYLLLLGNGTIDNKDRLGFGGNLIPTYQSLASLSPSNSFMTDDYFGLLADSEGEGAAGLLDIGIGRLPVRTAEEAEAVVDKIIRYDRRIGPEEGQTGDPGTSVRTSNYADWRNMVVFIADDGDFNTHLSHAERLGNIVQEGHPDYNLEKIYLDAYPMVTLAGGSRYPQVNQAINDRVNKGALLINYIGHGGVKGLAHQRVVTFEDIETWNNKYNLPVFMTATCEFSSFDQPDPAELSAGVRILLKPGGGAVALYTTTRLAWSGTNLTLNENFMKNAFRVGEGGEMPRLGDLIRRAKVDSDGNVQPWRLKNFVLLGDPSMRMGYPEYRVVTESLPDTLRAFQQVTVTGHIEDRYGNRMTGVNGVVYPTVYDKYAAFETLANAPGSMKTQFRMRNSRLYRGKASVTNGEFRFTFVVPKDIAYQYGEGRISYYFDDGERDGHGHTTGFIIGGTLQDYQADQEGPGIELYLNDTTFVSGMRTDANPVLLALLRDESGINIRGSIGHDIVAFLNEDASRPIVLNAYFQADRDSYQSGRVVYPFFRLEEGWHTLSLRAWDIHNNPSVASLEFLVSRSPVLAVENLLNYPNPFREGTHFVFSHTRPFEELDVRVEVFDLGGRLLKVIEQRVQSGGYRSPPIHWDGTADGGKPLGNGVYLYRLTVAGPDGARHRLSEKLVILRD